MLGRVEDCDIFIDDSILSKRHCTFQFVPGPCPSAKASDLNSDLASGPKELPSAFDGHWVLKDGYASQSLNGTWVYLSQEVELKHKMTFKASEILFEASVTN